MNFMYWCFVNIIPISIIFLRHSCVFRFSMFNFVIVFCTIVKNIILMWYYKYMRMTCIHELHMRINGFYLYLYDTKICILQVFYAYNVLFVSYFIILVCFQFSVVLCNGFILFNFLLFYFV